MSRLVISLATAVLVTGIGVFDPRAANAADFATVQASAPSGTNGTSGGMAYGLDMLSMNNEVCVGGEVGLPITGAIGVVMRPMILGSGSPSSLDVGGRVEMRFQTSLHDRLRAYFGAGPQGFYELHGTDAHHRDFSGGWDAGLEFFIDDHLALHWEVGTSGGGVFGGAGPVFAVGLNAYPGRSAHRSTNQ